MRDMYKNDAEASSISSEISYANSSVCGDPFYDRFPWFRLIGKAFLYLSNLLYPIALVQKIPIVSEKGDVKGYLRIAIQPITGEFNFFLFY